MFNFRPVSHDAHGADAEVAAVREEVLLRQFVEVRGYHLQRERVLYGKPAGPNLLNRRDGLS